MQNYREKTWQHEITGVDGHTILFGVNIFRYNWKRTGRTVKVCDPLYGKEYEFPVYSVRIKREEREFAAGEFSNCVWGFYILKD